jgi:hypothetical protein
MLILTKISPCPNPLNSGIPLPASLNIFPGLVPGGIFILKKEPFKFGNSASVPRQASLKEIVFSQIRFNPSLLYAG